MNWTANPVPKDLAEAIIQAFADMHGVSVAQILGERRNAHLVRARMDIIEHIVFDLGYSGHSVAKALRRDHTTIGHHLRKMAPRKLSPSFSSARDSLSVPACYIATCHGRSDFSQESAQ